MSRKSQDFNAVLSVLHPELGIWNLLWHATMWGKFGTCILEINVKDLDVLVNDKKICFPQDPFISKPNDCITRQEATRLLNNIHSSRSKGL